SSLARAALLARCAHPAPCTLSLHDALPICFAVPCSVPVQLRVRRGLSYCRLPAVSVPGRNLAAKACARVLAATPVQKRRRPAPLDRKSTRLNSSHVKISYAVFCLKKKKKKK